MCKLGYDATLSLMTAGIADEYMRDAILVEGNDDLNDTFSFRKLAWFLEDQVERRLSDEDADEDEMEYFLEAVRKHAEPLLEKVEKAEWSRSRTVKHDYSDQDLSAEEVLKELKTSLESFRTIFNKRQLCKDA